MAIIISPPIFLGRSRPKAHFCPERKKEEEEEEEGAANDGARRGIRGAQETSRKWVGAQKAVPICSHIVECSIGLNFSSIIHPVIVAKAAYVIV